MANVFVNPSMVAKEALRQLENNLVMGNLVYRGYEEEWQKNPNGWKLKRAERQRSSLRTGFSSLWIGRDPKRKTRQ